MKIPSVVFTWNCKQTNKHNRHTEKWRPVAYTVLDKESGRSIRWIK